MLRPVRIAVAAVFVLALAAAPALAEKGSGLASGKRQHKALGFYTPPKTLKGKHGDLIWYRETANTLTSAGSTSLVLYRSTSLKGSKIAVSGLVSVPKGKAPKGGWPVISWSHGTTGIADSCAPSKTAKQPLVGYVNPQLNTWLRKGYAVVRSDFEGLGTPGVHPYLVGHSEGRGAIDIVRAARQLYPGLSKNWVSAGHSQGGQAALYAAADGPKWAPELKLRGVAAFAPASHLGTQARGIGTLTQPSGLSGIAALVFKGATTVTDDVKPDQILSSRALALYPQVDTKCLGGLDASDSFGGLAPASLIRDGADLTALYKVLDEQENPDLKITVPVLLLQGLSDSTVFSFFTDSLKDELDKRGDKVDYRKYPGVTHGEIVAKSVAATNTFLKKRLG